MKPHCFSIAPPSGATFAVPAVLAAVFWATAALAQPAPSQNPASAAIAAQPPTDAATTGFKSAMDGYQPYTDEATTNWKAANDTVAQIGGWRAYAKEAAAEPATEVPSSQPASRAKP